MRDIRSHLANRYGVQVSPDLISKVTDAVTEEITTWQNRPLDPVWPVVYIDALWVKIRDGAVANRPVYLAVGVDLDGCKHILGLWIGPGEGEGARFWMSVLAELKNRGIADVLICCCDGLSGLPAAITTTWPATTVQTCCVHLMRPVCGSPRRRTTGNWYRRCGRSTPLGPRRLPSKRWPSSRPHHWASVVRRSRERGARRGRSSCRFWPSRRNYVGSFTART